MMGGGGGGDGQPCGQEKKRAEGRGDHVTMDLLNLTMGHYASSQLCPYHCTFLQPQRPPPVPSRPAIDVMDACCSTCLPGLRPIHCLRLC